MLLSNRENEIFQLIAQGYQNQSIAKRLCISVKTVEFHKENIKQKLGVRSVKELYDAGWSEDVIDGEPD